MQGRILKAIAGFYYVYVVGSGIYACKARGIFRNENRKPLVGDIVEMEVTHEADMEGNVTVILPRSSELTRPPVANIDQVIILFAMRTPDPNFLLLDRFLIEAQRQKVSCLIAFNKIDEADPAEIDRIRETYRGCGSPLYFLSVRTGEGVEALKEALKGKTTALAGPSGAGKSSFTNAVQEDVTMEVGDISKKLARGKNTTRHSQLIMAGPDTWLCDTPGFTALDTAELEKEDLENYYPEFAPYLGKCYFQGCAHIAEPGCRVKEALEDGGISAGRYEHYRYLYEERREEEKRKYK